MLTDPVRIVQAELSKPFPESAIGKLFKAYDKERARAAPKSHCQVCGSYHSSAPGVHLDYVGHANVRDRLLLVDPLWSWEPVSEDENGLPRFVRDSAGFPIGLWIKLTIHLGGVAVTRKGYGSVEPRTFDPEKQLIGDALRNAAMSFGVALTLWAKGDLESELIDRMDAQESAPPTSAVASAQPAAPPKTPQQAIDKMRGDRKPKETKAPKKPDPEATASDMKWPPGRPEWATSMVGDVPIRLTAPFSAWAHEKAPTTNPKSPLFGRTWEECSEGSENGGRHGALKWLYDLALDRWTNKNEGCTEQEEKGLVTLREMNARFYGGWSAPAIDDPRPAE